MPDTYCTRFVSVLLRYHGRWLPFSDLREVMEFKIVHAFFQTTFALPTRFNFALYMQEASDSYILSLVDVESSTWLILLATCFLNLARIKTWQVRAVFISTLPAFPLAYTSL